MKMRKRISIIIIVFLLAALAYFMWETAEIRNYAGLYEAVDAKDSAYELSLSKIGRISVADIGAGNPAVEGWIYRIPFSADNNRYKLIAGGETNEVFLDIGSNKNKTWVWLSEIGISEENAEPKAFRIITIENDSDHMQFNESGYDK